MPLWRADTLKDKHTPQKSSVLRWCNLKWKNIPERLQFPVNAHFSHCKSVLRYSPWANKSPFMSQLMGRTKEQWWHKSMFPVLRVEKLNDWRVNHEVKSRLYCGQEWVIQVHIDDECQPLFLNDSRDTAVMSDFLSLSVFKKIKYS